NQFVLDAHVINRGTLRHFGYGIETWTVNALGQGDVITVRPGFGPGYGETATVRGGSGNDLLVAEGDYERDWYVTDTNAGNINGKVYCTSVESLTGGTNTDRFHFINGGHVTGKVIARGSQMALDYSSYGRAVAVNLQTGKATGVGGVLDFTSVGWE